MRSTGVFECVGAVKDLGWIREYERVNKSVWVLSTECLYMFDEGCSGSAESVQHYACVLDFLHVP